MGSLTLISFRFGHAHKQKNISQIMPPSETPSIQPAAGNRHFLHLPLLHPRLLEVNLRLFLVVFLFVVLVFGIHLAPGLLAQEVLDRLRENIVCNVDTELRVRTSYIVS